MIELILTSIWIFLPSATSNMLASVSRHFPKTEFLAKPIDFNLEFRGKRVFGANKTFRGLFFGILFAILISVLQFLIFINFKDIFPNQIINFYSNLNFNPIFWGFLTGIGALTGDFIKSYFKRQINIESGKPFFPFDQVDFIMGSIFFTFFYIQLEIIIYLTFFLTFFFSHLIIKFVAFKVGIEKAPF